MSKNENLPRLKDTQEFDLPVYDHNALGLDGHRLQQLAATIKGKGMTLRELGDIATRVLDQENPLLTQFVFSVSDQIDKTGLGDARSFRRGAVLAVYLVDESSEKGAPQLGVESSRVAAHYSNQPPTLEDLQIASDGLLSSQVMLSGAFDEALTGLPQDTDAGMARFGAGITALCLMSSMQFGGTGGELSFS